MLVWRNWQRNSLVMSRLQVRFLSPAPYARVAQLVEQLPFKQWVAGSNPVTDTIHIEDEV